MPPYLSAKFLLTLAGGIASILLAIVAVSVFGKDTIEENCRVSSGIVAKAVQMHKKNASMTSVEKLADDIAPDNDRLRTFLIESIHIAYAQPEYILQTVQNGEWQRQCIDYAVTDAGGD